MPLTFEGTRAAQATLGSGVIMAVDDTVELTPLLLRIAAFFRDESCGQCVPCRVGTVRQEEALHRITRQRMRGSLADELALLGEIGLGMKDASICGLGPDRLQRHRVGDPPARTCSAMPPRPTAAGNGATPS